MPDRPKLQTVAREAGVSTATVSQVMRGAGRISEDTRKKVLQAARRLNYIPDGRAAAMRSGENREVGLVVHFLSNPFNAEVISGVSDQLENEGYLVSVLDSRDEAQRQRSNLTSFIGSARGGLLWVPAVDTPPETVELLASRRIPTVTFLRHAQGLNCDHVGIENAAATEAATNHLADLGHRHIAYLGGSGESQVRQERIAGYRKAMAARGLAEPVVWNCPDGKRAGMEAALALLDARPEVTAFVCNGDMIALGALHACADRGLVPGKDISVIGFDDVEDAALSIPPLTTMAVDPYNLGRRLALVLCQRIANPDMPPTNVSVPAPLVIRATTGPCTRQASTGSGRWQGPV